MVANTALLVAATRDLQKGEDRQSIVTAAAKGAKKDNMGASESVIALVHAVVGLKVAGGSAATEQPALGGSADVPAVS